MSQDALWMRRAVQLARENVISGKGGPFGAVIVLHGEVIAEGVNQVTATHDPTAHAEIVALRAACKAMGTFQLSGCDVYSSCEPCPMCLGALYWARPAALYFSSTRYDAAAIGFDDQLIYDEMALTDLGMRRLKTMRLFDAQAQDVFRAWVEYRERQPY